MNKKIIFLYCLMWTFFASLSAQTYVNESVTALWEVNTDPVEKSAIVTPENVFFSTDFSQGKMTIKDVVTDANDGLLYVRFLPDEEVSSNDPDCALTFTVIPASGYTFTPTQISFNVLQYGTGAARFQVAGKAGSAAEHILVGETTPNRGDKDDPATIITASISDVEVKGEAYTITVYMYNLASGKQMGFTNVVLSGTVNGTYQQTASYTLETVVSPVGAGEVKPDGGVYEEGTKVELTATENYGYRFLNWTDGSGTILSDESVYSHTMSNDAVITANFDALTTYTLNVNIEGGANEYMIAIQPEGTMIDGELRYEAGSKVVLSASNNQILTFLNWRNNTTSLEYTVTEYTITMDQDMDLTAYYTVADYIVGWDFYTNGGSNRRADFVSTADNDQATLIMYDGSGNSSGWLDKSIEAADGYDGIGAALIWKDMSEVYYFQTKVNASEFQDIHVSSKMWYNYGAYTVQQLQWSLNGSDWKTVATATFGEAKVWIPLEATLPQEANNAEELYIRWIADYESASANPSENTNGTGIGDIYVTGTCQLICYEDFPELSKTLPGEGDTGISASGRIIFTFKDKVKVDEDCTATLGDKVLTPSVMGTNLIFAYSGLEYGVKYTFTLEGNNVANRCDNYYADAISFSFTTMERPVVTPALYDYVVKAGDADDLKAALTAANAASGLERYRIFVPAGDYNLGEVYGTAIRRSNVSLIGEDMETTIIRNNPPESGIGITATILIEGASDTYIQDITLKNDWPYMEKSGGVAVCLQDKGNKTILKNVKMLSYQDTYFSDNATMRSYLEDCEIHGTVDFICGGGDVFFNRNLLYLENRTGNVIVASTPGGEWGYVFSDCTIDGGELTEGTYHLGRPWVSYPKTVYLNTMMLKLPHPEGWREMGSSGMPELFAEYNSHTATGTRVDKSNRKTVYVYDGVEYPYEGPTRLSEEEAAEYTISNVLGGQDGWMPNVATEQLVPLVISVSDDEKVLSWEDSPYALCYLIYKDGKYIGQTLEDSYTISENGAYVVHAANEMGGLSAASNVVQVGSVSIAEVEEEVQNLPVNVYGIDGQLIRRNVMPEEATKGLPRGLYIAGGKKVLVK